MADVKIYGVPPSSYTRTARMACIEKGVAYDLVEMPPGGEADGIRHPFGKIPVLRHGDFVLYETPAIARYVDAAFKGPALQPADVRERARMDQWISATCDYLYQNMVRDLVLQRIVAPLRGRQPDEARIAEALPKVALELGVIEAALAQTPFLAGGRLSLADLFLDPVLFWVAKTPEGASALKDRPATRRWQAAMAERASHRETLPPMPAARAAE